MLKRKNSLVIIIIGILFSLAFFSTLAYAQEAEYELEVVMWDWPSYQEGTKMFADHVESASNGRIKVNLYTVPEFGSERDVVELAQMGEIHMTTFSSEGALSGVLPELQVLNMPFLLNDSYSALKLMEGPLFEILQDLFQEKTNLRLLAGIENSYRHLYTSEDIRTPSDIRDQDFAIRTMNIPFHVRLWEELGATVHALPAEERYMALQTGMIDAIEGGPASVHDIGAFEVVDQAILTGHIFSFAYWTINDEWFSSLPEDLQEVISIAATEAALAEYGIRLNLNAQALRNIINEGNRITRLTPAEIEEWREIALPYGQEFMAERFDEEFIDAVIQYAQEAQEEVRRLRNRIK